MRISTREILFRNHRQVNILKTLHLGRLAFVEVGAMSVDRIQQVHPYCKLYATPGRLAGRELGCVSDVEALSERSAAIPPFCLRSALLARLLVGAV